MALHLVSASLGEVVNQSQASSRVAPYITMLLKGKKLIRKRNDSLVDMVTGLALLGGRRVEKKNKEIPLSPSHHRRA